MKPLLKIPFACFMVAIAMPTATAQENLVPNPSFEQFDTCPDVTSKIEHAIGWMNPNTYSPDYYNSCASSSGPGNGFGVPSNWYGNQMAQSGNAYVGIIVGGIGCDCREYIQIKLTESLTQGETYYVQFFVNLVDSNNYATNDIGAYFSNFAVSQNDNLVMLYNPQIANNPNSNPLTDRNVWVSIAGSFVSQGGEDYMTIGNFYDDSNTDTTHISGGASGQWFSYYFIDDVIVSKNPLNISYKTIGNNEINYFQNNNLIHFTSKKEKIIKVQLLSLSGKLIYSENNISVNSKTIHTNNFEKGAYIVSIETTADIKNFKCVIF